MPRAYLRARDRRHSSWGPEADVYIFDDVRFDQEREERGTTHRPNEGEVWKLGPGRRGENLGYKLRHKEGYFPCRTPDQLQDLR